MRLFTVGPVEMYERTLEIRSQQIPYFRCEEFSHLMMETAERLKVILKTDADSKCAILTGSGSAGMEAVVSGSFNSEDKVLVINGGSFGSRFVRLCDIYKIPYDTIELKYNETLMQAHLDKVKKNEYTAMLVNIHETSTGQLYDMEMLSSFCKQKQMKFVVDAISSFLCDEIKMDEYGIDCIILSSQKALAIAPGLTMVVMNQSFYEDKVKLKQPINLYLNLNEHIKNMERGQTPNTPAVGICYELLDMLRFIEERGMKTVIAQTKNRAMKFREEVRKLGLKIQEVPLSNALTPIIFEDGRAYQVYEYLKDKYDLIVTPSGGALKDVLIRVGHMGNMKDEYYDDLIEKMKEVL